MVVVCSGSQYTKRGTEAANSQDGTPEPCSSKSGSCGDLARKLETLDGSD